MASCPRAEKKEGKGKIVGGLKGGKKVFTSRLWACDPMEADVCYDQLSFGPTLEHGRVAEYGQQRALA
jgi:hypothetical protein